MRYKINFVRTKAPGDESYIETHEYESITEGDTVASALIAINKDLEDPIAWECSCLQKKCGACAMVIEGRPGLACDAVLVSFGKKEITVGPLRKFPIVRDLIVDRSILSENLKTLSVWLAESADMNEAMREVAYESSECIQCGCCLEVCPNFYCGGKFFGMSVVPLTMRLLTENDRQALMGTVREYSRHVFAGCGKSLACKDICPRNIDTAKLLVNANSIAIWKRKRGKIR